MKFFSNNIYIVEQDIFCTIARLELYNAYMNTLSLCMIVKDEEAALPRILEVAPVFADEIIVVDTGSTDGTIEICLSAGCKVSSFEWKKDFSAARNFAFSLAICDYLMWLDADDVITRERAEKICELKRKPMPDVVMLPYHMGDPPKTIFWRERILKRNMGFEFKGRVHEAIEVKGTVAYENIPIIHDKIKQRDPMRNLDIFRQMILEGHKPTGREAFYYGSELYYNGFNNDAVKWLVKALYVDANPADKGQAALFISRMLSDEVKKQAVLKKGIEFVFAPDLLYELGESYFRQKNLRRAKQCYLAALDADEHITFSSPDCSNLLPHLRLCYCYWHLGDKAQSKIHNDLALAASPNNKFALFNAKLFE